LHNINMPSPVIKLALCTYMTLKCLDSSFKILHSMECLRYHSHIGVCSRT
jgi:hypothetical protein